MEHFQVTTGPQPVKLTIADYELLLKSGALDGYPHVELVEGVIVSMNSERIRHGRAKGNVFLRLHGALEALGLSTTAFCEPTIRLSPNSLPEPDVIAVDPTGGPTDYHAGEAVRIVIEVADTSRASDLRYKFELYGDYGIPEYWIVDLNEDKIHVFWEPMAKGYRQQKSVVLGDRLESMTIPGLSIETANLY